MRFGALEAGGTKMVCAVGNERGEILNRISIPTETPKITMPKLLAYFQDQEIQALGIGCFGPIDLHPDSETYGYITTTLKRTTAERSLTALYPCATSWDDSGVPQRGQ